MFGAIHEAMRAAYHRAGQLFELQLDLLYQCDLDCEHCYLDEKARAILPTAFWRDVLDQAAELQVASVILSGGEVFLRRDLLELVAHARSLGLFVHLKSHGGRIDAAAAERLAELGVASVGLSLYSSDPVIHDEITRRPGSHDATLRGLHHLIDAGVSVLVSCSVMTRNRESWRGVVELCEALGVPLSLDGELRVALSGASFPQEIALPLDERVALERYRLGGAESCALPTPAADWGAGKSCAAGILSLYVSPEGELTPCVTWPEPIGDLRRGDRLAELWNESPRLAEIRAFTRRDREICGRCELRQGCAFCMGQAWTETHDPHRPVAALCETTEARAIARARAQGLDAAPRPPAIGGARFRILSARDAAQLERS